DARGQPAIQPGDARQAGGIHAGIVPVVLPRRAQDGADGHGHKRRAAELSRRDRRVDAHRRADSVEGRGTRPLDRWIAGVPTHMKVTRREFVKGGVAAFTVTLAAPRFFTELAAQSRARNLVVLNLSGGNDSLSMLIPYNDPFYTSRRPSLAVPAGRGAPNRSGSSGVAARRPPPRAGPPAALPSAHTPLPP